MCLGIPGQIVRVADFERKLAIVDVAGVERTINVACVANDEEELRAAVGAWVLVHVGFAMSRIDAAEAQKTLDLLRELGEAQAELAAMSQSAVAGSGRAP
jgi:hydrogenase expression/formation protein HypC